MSEQSWETYAVDVGERGEVPLALELVGVVAVELDAVPDLDQFVLRVEGAWTPKQERHQNE